MNQVAKILTITLAGILGFFMLVCILFERGCHSPPNYNFTSTKIELIKTGVPRFFYDSIFITYPKEEYGPHVDSALAYPLDIVDHVSDTGVYGILITNHLDYYGTNFSNTAYAIAEPGVLGSKQVIKTVDFSLVDVRHGTKSDFNNYLFALDSIDQYRDTKKYSTYTHFLSFGKPDSFKEKFNNELSKGPMDESPFLIGITQEGMSILPHEFKIEFRMEFQDGSVSSIVSEPLIKK